MVGGFRRRLLTAALAIALIASAGFAASNLGALSTTLPTVRLAKIVNLAGKQTYGTLSMDVLLGIRETFYGPQSLPTYFKPIRGEPVSLSLTDSPNAAPLVVQTNSSGLIRVVLPTSDYYAATLNDTRFHVTIPFSILAGTTTSVVVKAVRVSSPVLFSEYVRTAAGENGTSQTIFVKVGSAAEYSNLSLSFFLEGSRSGNKGFVDPRTNASTTQMPVKIVKEFAGIGGAWMLLKSGAAVSRDSAARLSLVTYVPVYTEGIGSH